jgi:hypothetical protein
MHNISGLSTLFKYPQIFYTVQVVKRDFYSPFAPFNEYEHP